MDDLSSSGVGTSAGWNRTFETLKKLHDDAYVLIEEALELVEQNNKDAAMTKLNAGLALIDQALSLPRVCPPNPALSWERAGIMVQKMQKSKKEILHQIADIQASSTPVLSSPTNPPSYEEAMGFSAPASPGVEAGAVAGPSSPTGQTSGTSSNKALSNTSQTPRTYRELAEALSTLQVDGLGESEGEVLFAHDNVRLYFIQPDGTVSGSSEPDRMVIVRFSEEVRGNAPPAYLQVGGWIYPLVPGVSPCFRTNYRAFILPDIHSEVEGSAVGIILPEDCDESVQELLECILDGIILQLEESEMQGRVRREVGFAHSVVRGAHWISSKLVSGAERAGNLMNTTTPKLLDHIDREEPKQINPSLSKSIEVARNVSGKAVQVTGFVASKVGTATSALGRFLAPHFKTQGTRLLTKGFSMDEDKAKQRMDDLLEVTAGAVEAFGTVYGALDHSASILGRSLANNTVTVVSHKYGHQAGELTGSTFNTVGNVYLAGYNIKKLKPKYVAKVAVKETGKAVIEEQRNHLLEPPTDNSTSKGASKFDHSD